MTKLNKIILSVALVLVVCLGVAWFGARYLVSRLDGTGGVHAPALQQYSSEDGVQFLYPAGYALSSHISGTAERQWDTLDLVPPQYQGQQYTEGPPVISMSVFQNPENLSLLDWVQGDARSNFKLLSDPGGMGSSTVGGEPALVYTHTGLYETDTAVVAHAGKIYMFEAGWMSAQDPIREDFQNLLSTVQFTR